VRDTAADVRLLDLMRLGRFGVDKGDEPNARFVRLLGGKLLITARRAYTPTTL
jgi:hypothetical protein